MSNLLIIRKRQDNKYVSIKFPSRSGNVWITESEYETLKQLMNSGDTWDKASAELILYHQSNGGEE